MRRYIIFCIVLIGFTFSIKAQVTIYKSTNSTTINKDCVSGDCENGWGEKNYSQGYYDGFWKNGERHGYGLFDWDDSGKYIGFWEYDKMTGYGTYLGENMDMVGEFKNGYLEGLGYIIENDVWEQGVYNSSLLDESYSFIDNEVNIGCTAGDCNNKYGRMKWSNGDSFTGFFRNGNMFMGTYLFDNGDKYTGLFNTQNEFHGQGRFFFENGEYYGGEWKNGEYYGRGYYHDKDYNQQIGEWRYGKLINSLKN